MKLIMFFAVTALVFLGCRKDAEPAATSQTQTTADAATGNSATPPPKYVTAVAENKPAANVAGEVNAFLTEQLRVFIQQKQRLPADFAELARSRLDSVPRPPEGKKWVIDTATREVKAVSAQ